MLINIIQIDWTLGQGVKRRTVEKLPGVARQAG